MVVSPVLACNMDKLVSDFADYLRQERMRGSATIKRYLAVLEDFAACLPALVDNSNNNGKSVALESVEKTHLVSFLRRQEGVGDEPSRAIWNIRLAALRSFYDYLFKMELVSLNPAMRIDRLKTNPRESVPLSLDELLALLDAMNLAPVLNRARNVAIVQVLFHCALRVAEVVSLSVDQLDFENYVLANIRTKGSKWLSVPLNDLVADSLQCYLKVRDRVLPHPYEPALFLSTRGKRLSVRSVQELVKNYARRAGIARNVTPHLLRHSGATELAELGTPISVVQEICGHASVTTTQRYVHVRGAARRLAIDNLGREVTKRSKQRRAAAGRGGAHTASQS